MRKVWKVRCVRNIHICDKKWEKCEKNKMCHKKLKEVIEVWVMWYVPKMWVVQRNVRSKSKKCEKKLKVREKLICVRKVIEVWDICN